MFFRLVQRFSPWGARIPTRGVFLLLDIYGHFSGYLTLFGHVYVQDFLASSAFSSCSHYTNSTRAYFPIVRPLTIAPSMEAGRSGLLSKDGSFRIYGGQLRLALFRCFYSRNEASWYGCALSLWLVGIRVASGCDFYLFTDLFSSFRSNVYRTFYISALYPGCG